MSIIQEALKKVQRYAKDDRSRTPRQQEYEPERARPLDEAPSEKSADSFSIKKIDPKIAITLAVITLIIAAIITGRSLHKNGQAVKMAVTAPAAPAQEAAYKPEKPAETAAEITPKLVETKPQLPELILNGIMYVAGIPRAIINNSMVEVGDDVSGAAIIKINRKNVILRFNGIDITLNLK